METFPIFKAERVENASSGSVKKPSLKLKRISPFLLLTIFLIFWFPFVLITRIEIETTLQIISFPFVIAYMGLADFALWNYFAGRKKWLIWTLEGVFSVIILYWFMYS